MWMARKDSVEKLRAIDFASARDEGLANLDRVVADYPHPIEFSRAEIKQYLIENIVFHVDEEVRKGLVRYFDLAAKYTLIEERRPLEFTSS